MNLIVAVDKNWAIGKDNDLLFKLPTDLQYFQNQTQNNIVIMGKNTLNSFLDGKPLKNRINFCLTSAPNDNQEGIAFVSSLVELFEKTSFYESKNIFVIGGASVYQQLLSYCKTAFVTKIESEKPADRYFPNLDKKQNWKLVETSDPVFENDVMYYFCKYENSDVKKFNYGYEEEIELEDKIGV